MTISRVLTFMAIFGVVHIIVIVTLDYMLKIKNRTPKSLMLVQRIASTYLCVFINCVGVITTLHYHRELSVREAISKNAYYHGLVIAFCLYFMIPLWCKECNSKRICRVMWNIYGKNAICSKCGRKDKETRDTPG